MTVGSVAPGDTVQYYGGGPGQRGQRQREPVSAGASGLTATRRPPARRPAAPTATCLGGHLGSLNVGTGETITSLTNPGGLFEFINNNVLTGNTTINLTSDLIV